MASKKEVREEVQEVKEVPVRGENLVEIELIKDTSIDKYKDDLFVGVNGRTFKIQRGKRVKVPDYVAEVIRHSQRADQLAQEKREALAEKAQEV